MKSFDWLNNYDDVLLLNFDEHVIPLTEKSYYSLVLLALPKIAITRTRAT